MNFVCFFLCSRRDTKEKLKITIDRTLSLPYQWKELQSHGFSHCRSKPSAVQMLLFREGENESQSGDGVDSIHL